MILFYTNSAKHLANNIKVRKGKCTLSRFSDGEIYVKVNEKVRNKKVWVLGSTIPPADNLVELTFLLDALKRAGAKSNLLIPYFGYARQDQSKPGECLSAQVICDWLKRTTVSKTLVIDMHSPRLKKFLRYENIIPFELFLPYVKKAEVIVAPDVGALRSAKNISKASHLPIACMEKVRSAEKVKIVRMEGNVKGKNVVIVDDMITTGGTIVAASKQLKQQGAGTITVVATHGLFTAGAAKRIQQSPIKQVIVTNTLPQTPHPKVKVVNIAGFIADMLK